MIYRFNTSLVSGQVHRASCHRSRRCVCDGAFSDIVVHRNELMLVFDKIAYGEISQDDSEYATVHSYLGIVVGRVASVCFDELVDKVEPLNR